MKRKILLETGKELFWKHGIKKVSIEEICKEAKVSKMTFYKHFQNKIEFAQYILEQVIGQALTEFEDIVKSDKPFTEKVKKMFVIKYEAAQNISREFVDDMYKNPDFGLHLYMEKQGMKSLQIFNQFIIDSQQKGLIRKEISIEFILEFMNQISGMLNNEALMNKYEHTHDFIMEVMNFMFYGLLEPDKK